ncbi:Structure-specific endonuclease subunit SLX1 homolog [Sergentomyia squamirostris]
MEATIVEDFYGVYLLVSRSESSRFTGKTYIGYTVDPNRRISQHNRGKERGGAKKTSDRGPWQMILIIHGFPNNISALRFEWAWQQPHISRRLKNIPGINKKSSQRKFDLQFRILTEMLRLGPWNRLPLVIRWLTDDHVRDFPPEKMPPVHMEIQFGQVKRKRKKPGKIQSPEEDQICLQCSLCLSMIENRQKSLLTCMNITCTLQCHIICLARMCITESNQYIPIEGDCPICFTHFLWGDLIRKRNGCCDLVAISDDTTDTDDNYIAVSIESISTDEDDDF